MAECSNWQVTAQMFSSLFEKPKMSQKYLSKPPFKYIFDIYSETSKQTGFASTLFTPEEQDPAYYDSREKKITFLQKLIDVTSLMLNEPVDVKPIKVVAGQEPDNTNNFLQAMYRAAVSLVNSDPFCKQVNEAQSGGSKEQEKPQNQKEQEKKPEKKQPNQEQQKKKPEQRNSKDLGQKAEQAQKEKEQKEQALREQQEKKEAAKQQKQQQQQKEQQAQEAKEQAKLQQQQQQEVKTIVRPPSAVRKPSVKPNVKEVDERGQKQVTAGVIKDGDLKETDLQEQSELNKQNEDEGPQNNQQGEKESGGIKLRGFGKKKKKEKETNLGGDTDRERGAGQTVSSNAVGVGGGASAEQIEVLTKSVQNICQNANPLGKSLEFINDDIESMNNEHQYWQKQYKSSKEKMVNELRITEETLQPMQDRLAEIKLQIQDQKGKIQNVKSQIIKNQAVITNLLHSFVTHK